MAKFSFYAKLANRVWFKVVNFCKSFRNFYHACQLLILKNLCHIKPIFSTIFQSHDVTFVKCKVKIVNIHRSNTISLIGNVSCWFLQIWFIVAVGILIKIFESKLLQEVSAVFKMIEFAIHPLIHILTSTAIRTSYFESAKLYKLWTPYRYCNMGIHRIHFHSLICKFAPFINHFLF